MVSSMFGTSITDKTRWLTVRRSVTLLLLPLRSTRTWPLLVTLRELFQLWNSQLLFMRQLQEKRRLCKPSLKENPEERKVCGWQPSSREKPLKRPRTQSLSQRMIQPRLPKKKKKPWSRKFQISKRPSSSMSHPKSMMSTKSKQEATSLMLRLPLKS